MTQEQGHTQTSGQAENTDREIWPANGEFYADKLLITKDGGLVIICGGFAITKQIREWHRLGHYQKYSDHPALSPAPQPDAAPVEAITKIALEADRIIWAGEGGAAHALEIQRLCAELLSSSSASPPADAAGMRALAKEIEKIVTAAFIEGFVEGFTPSQEGNTWADVKQKYKDWISKTLAAHGARPK